ncbi:MAG: histidine phosphatase family protein [Sphingobacteriales bacterium]|nr:MAG: histidine phosphatase family protein [Sphingobacteriales bacterium]
MKTVLLVRHAKSSWEDPMTIDFDRPLNERGKKDAPAMAKRIKEKGFEIDSLISSPAKRAKKTAKLFAEVFKYNEEKIIYKTELYHADPATFYSVIEQASNNHESIAVFSHNPGITYFVNELTEVKIDEVPTCGVFALKAECSKWKDFKKAKKQFLFFDYPKAMDAVTVK